VCVYACSSRIICDLKLLQQLCAGSLPHAINCVRMEDCAF
jgi:hypothetical protein